MVMMVLMGARVARTCLGDQRTLQVGSDRLVGIGFRSHQGRNAFSRKALLQPRPHAGRNQRLYVV